MNPGSDDTSDLEKVQELLRVGIEDQQTVISRPNQVRGPAADLKNELGSGRYEPGPEIGRGGMGKVVATLEKPLHRSVALKVLLSSSNDEYQRRFIREARITGRLEHPSIVPIHELNVDERGRIFYTMKLVKGITLQDLLVRLRERDVEALQRYRLPALLTIFQKVCDAVAFAHAQSPRIIHRDLKPANIMIGDYGEVLVMDWGAAKLLSDRNARGQTLDAALDTPPSSTASGEHQVDNNAPGLLNDDEPLVTQAGMVIGTPGYMAPEQVSGRTDGVDECTDIYALGAILYSLLTLEAPGQVTTRELEQLDAESRAKVSTLFRDRVAPLLANSENRKSLSHLLRKAIPDSLVAVALKAMSFRPEDRFQSVKQLQADVGAYQAGRATTAEQAGAWKQLKLLVARNKVLFSAIAAIFIVLLAATAISMHERQATLRSNEALQLTLHHASDADLEAARQRFQAGAWREGVALLGRSLSFWPENKQATSYLLTAIEFGYGDRDKLPIFGVYHSDELEEAAFSADGEYFITTSDDHTARTWKAQNGAPVARLSRHSAPVWCGRFSPNSRKVVTTDEVGVGYVWDPRTGNALIRPLQHGKPQLDTVSIVETAVFSADGHRILTGCWDHTARLWNADTGEELAELLNPNRVADAVFSPDETRILVSYWNGGAVLWDASTFQPIGSPMAHSATVRRSVFTPDGNKIVTSSLDKTARIWDGHTARPLSAPIVHGDKVFDLDIRSDGKVFVTACYDNNARLWSLDYGTPIGSPMHHDGPINTAVFSPDGKRVLTASRDKTARLWDAASCKQLGNPMRHDEMVVKAIFSPDGTKVLSIGADAAAYLWNGQPPAPPGEAIPIPGSAYFAQFVTGSDNKVFVATREGNAGIWSLSHHKFVTPLIQHGAPITLTAFNSRANRVATASSDGVVRLWNCVTGRQLGQTEPSKAGLIAMEFAADGSSLFASYEGRLLIKWTMAASGMQIGDTMKLSTNSQGLAVAPEGSELAMTCGGGNDLVQFWDSSTGKFSRKPITYNGTAVTIAYHPGGHLIATGCEDHTVRIWSLDSGEQQGGPLYLTGNGSAVHFSGDGNVLLIGGNEDNQVYSYDTTTHESRYHPLPHPTGVSHITSNATGSIVITVAADGIVRLWRMPTSSGVPPSWVGDYLRSLGGLTFSPQQELVQVSTRERLKLRDQLLGRTPDGTIWDKLMRWSFEQERSPAPDLTEAKNQETKKAGK